LKAIRNRLVLMLLFSMLLLTACIQAIPLDLFQLQTTIQQDLFPRATDSTSLLPLFQDVSRPRR
jgi:hypothetical protein